MKRIIYLLFAFLGCWSCHKDDAVFEIPMPKENISFKGIAGGAVMYYKLPQNSEISGIRVRYKDAFGNEVIKSGSYAVDSLVLLGFNEARTKIPVHITLCDRSNVESEPIEMYFDTKDSGPVAFFDKLEVLPAWDGFTLSYSLTEDVKGMAHVFYVGKNPLNQEPDTILLKTFLLNRGTDTISFELKQITDANDIVVKTEDFRGYMVKQKVWEKVKAYKTKKLEVADFEFTDPLNLSIEDPEAELGRKYLFDGDAKGKICFMMNDAEVFRTYLAGPECFGKPLFIIDLKASKHLAALKFYGMLDVRWNFPYPNDERKYSMAWGGLYTSRLPCDVVVYGSNDKADDTSWEKIGHFKQDRELANAYRWCERCCGAEYEFAIKALEDIEYKDPAVMNFQFPYANKPYRYLKVVVNDTFKGYSHGYYYDSPNVGGNTDEYVTFHELEIFTEKD